MNRYQLISMGFEIYVQLEDDVQFDSYNAQDGLARDIDSKTYLAPEFVGVDDSSRVKVSVQSPSLNGDDPNNVGQIVANYFDTSVKSVRVEEKRGD